MGFFVTFLWVTGYIDYIANLALSPQSRKLHDVTRSINT